VYEEEEVYGQRQRKYGNEEDKRNKEIKKI